jgi:branched-chain amino acid transport system permease protein
MLATIDPKMFTFVLTFNVLMIVVTGGLGSITGSVLAGIVITILLEWLRIVENPIYFGDWELQGIPGMRMVVFSLALICIILFRREGFMGKREFNWDWVRQRFGNKAGRHAG